MTRSTCILLVLLTLMSVLSLFVGAADITPADVLSGDIESLELMLISRLPRLLAILCTGMGMSIAGLIMQQLCANKFVSPTTGATISSAQFGILIALLFFPDSTLWSRALFAFAAAILGTWTFVWFILRMPMKDPVMVPLVGIMFGNVIGGVTNFLAYRFDMTQALSTWLVGHFSLVLRGNFELVYLVLPLIVLAWIFAKHFNIVGMGRDFSKNLGVNYTLVLFSGLTIAAMITAAIVSVVGSIPTSVSSSRTSSPSSRVTTCAPPWLTQRFSARSSSSAATSSDAWLSPPMNYRLNSSSARSAVFSSSRSSSTDFVLGACRSTKRRSSDSLVLTVAHLPAEAPNDFRHLHRQPAQDCQFE